MKGLNHAVDAVDAVDALDSANQLSEFMLANIHYANELQRRCSADHGYCWKTPAETLNDGYGFCYDLSAFALYCLKRQGYNASRLLFTYWGQWGSESGTGHFVCVFREQGAFHAFDNGYLKGPYHSLRQIIRVVAKGRPVQGYQLLSWSQIPFHTPYRQLGYLASS